LIAEGLLIISRPDRPEDTERERTRGENGR